MTKIPYVTFMKHAQKVTKGVSKGRPVLGGVMHRDGNLIVTDSHRLYIAEGAYDGPDKNENPKTGELIEGNYPDVSRLLPDPSDAKFTSKINVVTAHKAVKLIEQAGKVEKATDLIEIMNDSTGFYFRTGESSAVDVMYKISDEQAMIADDLEILASARYVAEAFALLKDAGLAEVTFNYYGSMRPFTFTGGNLTVLLMPVRSY